MQPARAVAELMLDPVLTDLDFSGDDGVILFVNSMGATPLIELYVMYSEFAAILDKAGVRIARSLVGPYITSLDMAGCSVTRAARRRRAAAAVGSPGQHACAAEGMLIDVRPRASRGIPKSPVTYAAGGPKCEVHGSQTG